MERKDWYKVVNDKTGEVLLDQKGVHDPDADVWEFAYRKIKEDPNADIFIEVYEGERFEHWVDAESIVRDYEYWKEKEESR